MLPLLIMLLTAFLWTGRLSSSIQTPATTQRRSQCLYSAQCRHASPSPFRQNRQAKGWITEYSLSARKPAHVINGDRSRKCDSDTYTVMSRKGRRLASYRAMLFRQLRYRSAKAGTDEASSDFTVTAALAALLSMIVSRR